MVPTPLPSSSSSAPSPSSTSPISSIPSQSTATSSSQTVMIGAIVGSLFGGALLSFAGFCFYKWNKNNHRNRYEYENSEHDHGHEIVQLPKNGSSTNHQPQSTQNEYTTNHQPKKVKSTKNEYATNHQPIPASVTNKNGRKSSTTANDDSVLRELQQEIQDLKQIIIQTNRPSTSSMRND
jgi:hypothetical protein